MPNMGYVKFQNTLEDLIDCNESVTDFIDGTHDIKDLSKEEMEAMQKMTYLVNEMKLGFEELEIEPEEC